MTRIKVIVEGQTEEAFLNDVVAPSLWTRQILITPIVLGVPGHKGGNVKYQRVRKDILLELKQDRTAYCSTMFDLYGLGTDFPGFDSNLNGLEKATRIEQALLRDIARAVPSCFTMPVLSPTYRCTNMKSCFSAIPATSPSL